MSEKVSKAQQVVLDQIRKNKGDSTSAIAWRHLGGGFSEGLAVGSVTITPAQLVFALGMKARVSELARAKKLERKSTALNVIPGTTGDGYWPSGTYGHYRARPSGTVQGAGAEKVVSGVAMASKVADVIADLDE